MPVSPCAGLSPPACGMRKMTGFAVFNSGPFFICFPDLSWRTVRPSPHSSPRFLPPPGSRSNPAGVDCLSPDEMPVRRILFSSAFVNAPPLKLRTPSSDRFSVRSFLFGKSIEFLTDFRFWRSSHFLHRVAPRGRKERGVPPCRTLIVNKRPRICLRDRCSTSRYGGQGLHLKVTTPVSGRQLTCKPKCCNKNG